MIGSGIGGIAGGYISEALGYSFTTWAAIGSFAGAIIGGQVHKGIQASAALKAQPIGTPFNPNGTLTQIGVDSNTLTISRTLNPAKLSAVRTTINKSGMYGTIRVMQNGYIIDGNHRFAVARLLGIAVDVVIGWEVKSC